MTVIAWDGKTLAADKCSIDVGTRRTTTKIFRAPDGSLFGAAGTSHMAEQLKVWYLAGAGPETFPDKDAKCNMLVVKPDGTTWVYDGGPYPDRYEDPVIAIGSGRGFAIGAMVSGASAEQAVEIASYWDDACGRGIDKLEL